MEYLNRNMKQLREGDEHKTDERRSLYINDWNRGYERFHYFKVFGTLTYSYTFKDGDIKVEDEIHTSIPDLIILENGEDQKLWIETIKSFWKQNKRHKQTLKDIKDLKWISWEDNDTINQERYIVEYTKVKINDSLLRDSEKQKIIEGGQTIRDVWDILQYSKSIDDWKPYTDGTTYKGYNDRDIKHCFFNENVVITRETKETRKKIYEKVKQTGSWDYGGLYTGGSYRFTERKEPVKQKEVA